MRRDLGLHDDFVAGQGRQDVAELHFGRAVAARGLEMIDPKLKRATDCGFEVFLVLFRDLLRFDIPPFVLIAHSAAGNHRHTDFGFAEASVFHRRLRFVVRFGDATQNARPFGQQMRRAGVKRIEPENREENEEWSSHDFGICHCLQNVHRL